MKFNSSPKKTGTWNTFSIEDICSTFTSGGTPSRKKPEFYIDGTIPWVKTKELVDDIIFSAEEHITKQGLKSSSAKLLPINTVMLAMYGATVGRLGILGIPATCNQAAAAMVVHPAKADFRFLYYLLLNHREEIIGLATGGAQQNLSGQLIKKFEFSFPQMPQQNVIGEILFNLDDKIRKNKALSKTLEDIAQTIFKSWFIDFDPVKAKMAGEKPVGLDAATAALFPDTMEDSELGLIPMGWDIKNISSLGKVVTGKTPSTKKTEYWGIDIPFVTIPDMHGNPLITTTARSLSKAGADSQRNQYVAKGSVMVSCIATPGLVSYATMDCQTNQQINSVIPTDDSDGAWLFWHLRGMIPSLIRNSGVGTVFANLNKSDFSNIQSIIPPRNLIHSFSKIVETVLEEMKSLSLEASHLASIRDALLPRLISGELQIPEEMLAS